MNIKLLKDLNFAEKINACEPVTEAGKDMLKAYKGYLYTNPVNCGIVNGFIQEAQAFSFDTGMVSILESVLSFINENKISWKLASACESIQNNPSTYNYIAKVSVGQVEKLLEMNESEVVSYIKAGALKNVQYIPEFRSICKEIYKTTVNETFGTNYVVTNPISFVVVSEGAQYFNVLGKTFKISENTISESQCDDKTFNRVNALLESFSQVEGGIEYKYSNGSNEFKFTISENKELNCEEMSFSCGNINEKFETPVAFRQYCDNLSKTMRINEKMQFMNITTAVAEVYEAMDSIVVLDCVNIMRNSLGTICAISEAKNNVNLTVFRNVQNGTSSKNYDYVVEALNEVTRLTGIDLKFMYESRIDEDCKKQDPAEYAAIKEELAANAEAQMDLRKKKIAMLAEKYKNDPARIALLNKTARELAILESK